MEYQYNFSFSTYNSHRKLLVNRHAPNVDDLKNSTVPAHTTQRQSAFDKLSFPKIVYSHISVEITETIFILKRNLYKQEIRTVEHGICPIAEFTSP